MQSKDRPFRFALDTCAVWLVLAITAFWMTYKVNVGPWNSRILAVIVLPLAASLALYGPVLLARQIVHTTVPGWFVVRIFLSILILSALFFGVVWCLGNEMEILQTILVFAVLQLATVYLHWKLKDKRTYYDPLRDGNPGLVRRKAATIGDLVVVLILLIALGFFLWGYINQERRHRWAIQHAPAGWKQLRRRYGNSGSCEFDRTSSQPFVYGAATPNGDVAIYVRRN